MSAKLVMKRKLDTEQKQSPFIEKIEIDESAAKSRPSSSTSKFCKQNEKCRQAENKRVRCETPPELGDFDIPPSSQTSRRYRHFLKVIQLKMMQLQNELDDFEHYIEVHKTGYFYENNRHNNEISQVLEEDAEALGFATCAHETILFLERAGVPSNSILYRRLRDALMGRP